MCKSRLLSNFQLKVYNGMQNVPKQVDHLGTVLPHPRARMPKLGRKVHYNRSGINVCHGRSRAIIMKTASRVESRYFFLVLLFIFFARGQKSRYAPAPMLDYLRWANKKRMGATKSICSSPLFSAWRILEEFFEQLCLSDINSASLNRENG